MAVGPLSNDTCDHLTQGHCNQLVDVNTTCYLVYVWLATAGELAQRKLVPRTAQHSTATGVQILVTSHDQHTALCCTLQIALQPISYLCTTAR